MAIKKYGLLIECPDETYEIFHIIRFQDTNEFGNTRIARFDTAINENKDIIGMDVSEIPNAIFNAYWDGSKFISESEAPLTDSNDVSRFAFLYDNVIFFMIGFDKYSIMSEKFRAALSQNIIIKDITGQPDSILGWIWNGTEFVDPENV